MTITGFGENLNFFVQLRMVRFFNFLMTSQAF